MRDPDSYDKRVVQKNFLDLVLSKTVKTWLEEKRKVDDLDGLWRIHDNIYDVTEFIGKHPGGKIWLEESRGTDITEAFESHHIKSDIPEAILKNFFVKKATKPRGSPYTFHEDGFYRTFKKKVRDALKTIPDDGRRTSDMYIDLLFLATFVFACLANKFSMYTFAILASLSCAFVIGACHNYRHQRDNIRMLYADFFFVTARAFRLIHVLSHHAYSNSRTDLQLTFFSPVANLFPEKKSFVKKYFAWIGATFFVYPLSIYVHTILSTSEAIILKKEYVNLLLPVILPMTMYYTGSQTLLSTIGIWQMIICLGGATFVLIAFTTTHVHPDLYVEGDQMRPKEELDWGIGQLDTVFDRTDIMGNQFLTLVLFGDHALHHLLPTVDHSSLKYLYPVLEETLKQFNMKSINLTTTAGLYLGYFKQAARETPKTLPPSLGRVY